MKLPLPKSRTYRTLIYLACTLLVLLAIDLAWVRLWRHITISPQTTYITSPLKPDGTPDYLKYLDDKNREGVTPENNAAIPFFQAISISTAITPNKEEVPTDTKEFCDRLGIVPPTQAQTPISYEQYVDSLKLSLEQRKLLLDKGEYILTHPWSNKDYPASAAWLTFNEKILRALPEITSRPRWYIPIFKPTNRPLYFSPLPHLKPLHQLSNLSLTRAMLNIHDQRFSEAQADILAIHRIARLYAQGNFIINHLFALKINLQALQADLVLASAPELPRNQLHQFLKELATLPPWPPAYSSCNIESERLDLLDSLTLMAMHPENADYVYNDMMNYHTDDLLTAKVLLAIRPAHYNAALQEANIFYDRYYQAALSANFIERTQQASQVSKDFEAYENQHKTPLVGDPARQIVCGFMPAYPKVFDRHDLHEATQSLTRIALALIAYHADTTTYPDTLETLTPKYLPSIPLDPYNNQPLHYKVTKEGFLLYSVGPNQKDNGGKKSKNSSEGDIVIQLPLGISYGP